MFENIRLSFQGIWSHKMRSFLTMLGIIIGIAAIIAIVSTIKGTNEQIKENLIGSGENTVEVSLYQGEWEYEMDYNGVPQGVPLVTDDVMSDIKDLDHVVNASAYLSRQDYSGVYHLNTAFSGGYVRGIDNSYFDTCNYIMKEGRAFTDEDFKKYKKVAILDTDSANALFQGEDSVGNTIEIQKEPYTVIGIVTKAKVFEPVIVDSGIDYTSPAFRNDDGTTRILGIWDQTLPEDTSVPTSGVHDSTIRSSQVTKKDCVGAIARKPSPPLPGLASKIPSPSKLWISELAVPFCPSYILTEAICSFRSKNFFTSI